MLYPKDQEASPAPETIGAVLRRWRVEAGIKQTDLGRLIDIEQSHVSAIERDDKTPSVRTLGAWARACGRSVSDAAPLLARLAGFDGMSQVAA